MIMSTDLLSLLEEARKLPTEERRRLATTILEEIAPEASRDARKQAAAVAIVEETFGSIKAPDRATLIRLAEDEEFSGY
jgi:hypothetical protein